MCEIGVDLTRDIETCRIIVELLKFVDKIGQILTFLTEFQKLCPEKFIKLGSTGMESLKLGEFLKFLD